MKKDSFAGLTTCPCGWVHFKVSLESAIHQICEFNIYYDRLSKEKQQDYYGGNPAILENYLRCFLCGGSYKDFLEYKEGDCPDGCTIQPILDKVENV